MSLSIRIASIFCAITILIIVGCARHPDAQSAYQTVEMSVPAGVLKVGADTSSLVLVEFGSHLCPACRTFVDSVVPTLEQQFIDSGRLLYLYVEAGARSADDLSGVVECRALDIGVFQARRELFQLLDSMPAAVPDLLRGTVCARDPSRKARRNAERVVAASLKVPGTPTLILGRAKGSHIVGWVLVGSPSADSLATLVRSAERHIRGPS